MNLRIVTAIFLGCGLGAAIAAAADAPPAPVYVSDAATDLIVSVTQGWGELGINTAVKPAGREASAMQIKERHYSHGLGSHAPGEIVIDLAGRYATFEAEIGIQWQGGSNQATAVFQVFVDDEKRFDSGVVRETDEPRAVKIDVAGGEELRLVATDAGDGITCDCANWAEARLTPHPSPGPRRARAALDAAAFASVVTSNPARMQGTHASRTEEFPAGDVLLAEEVLPDDKGMYRAGAADAAAAIGLEWAEDRELRRIGFELAPGAALADPAAVEAQVWLGESPWQGRWQKLEAAPEIDGGRHVWPVRYIQITRGTPKVRWVFPAGSGVAIQRFLAVTRSTTKTAEIRLERENPVKGKPCRIEMYNGTIIEPPQGMSSGGGDWNTAEPLRLKVEYAVPRPYKGDRTVLRLSFADTAFGVAVEDLLANDCVYVPHAGLFATREPAAVTLAEYKERIAGRKTVREEVENRADQTLAQAFASVHNPVQDLGPTMLSLACDNRKFVAERDGTIVFDLYGQPDDPPQNIPTQARLEAKFDAHGAAVTRHLEGGWLPIPVATVDDGGLVYRRRAFVAPVGDPPPGGPAWLREKAVCVAEYEIENTRAEAAPVSLQVSLSFGGQPGVASWQGRGERTMVGQGDRIIAMAVLDSGSPRLTLTDGSRASGMIPPQARWRMAVLVPAWEMKRNDEASLPDPVSLRRATAAYWQAMLQDAMQVSVPDPLLNNILRASQVHCLMAARNEERGARVSPWISSDRYGPLESEANSIIHGMGLWGHDDFALRGLDFFSRRYNVAGFLTTGYTVVGTGWNLWTLAEHYRRTGDRAWLEASAPTVDRACQWLVRQRAKTEHLDAGSEKLPGYGLMPPGVSADWNRYAYRFFNDAHYAAGLRHAAEALQSIGRPGADELVVNAARYREEILRAFRWTQARSPVVMLGDGTWVPNHPGIVGYFGNVDDYTPGEDANRTWAGSVEIGSHYLAALGIMDAQATEVDWMLDYLEDHQFLRTGMGDYPEEASRKDPFNLGGFAKVQPYYGRTPEIYAIRDEVKPFIRTYFNAIPSLVSRENLSFWEHFHNMGGWNKTHETGWFLAQSRLVFVQERGEELWLAPFATSAWLADGGVVEVRQAPTRFGRVSYRIASSVAAGRIEATIEPPQRTPPRQIVMRLRHPEGKPIKQVFVNGEPHERFDVKKETITLETNGEKIEVRAEY